VSTPAADPTITAVFRVEGITKVYSMGEIEVPSSGEVLSGLAEGDEVIVHPSDLVEDGVSVAPR
jgi:hypothetical protein